MIEIIATQIVDLIASVPEPERVLLIDAVGEQIIVRPEINKVQFVQDLNFAGINTVEFCKRKTPPAP